MRKKPNYYFDYQQEAYNYIMASRLLRNRNLLKLCNEVGLNEYETNLLTCINQDMSRVAISFKLGCSEWKISTDMRKIFTKIMDYTSLD